MKVKEVVEDIVKSREDKRCYRGLVLENDMKVLLISDVTTDKAAASMDVHVGHMSDPTEIPGLAHFCEHMLFLGSEKYPEENAYTQFIHAHGGMSNAFTSLEHTNFYFDVSHDHLAAALDRFAQFFICPLFTESAAGREVNAVESENVKNLNSDTWRLFQLEKSTSDPTHPYSKFGTGNKSTLETEPTKNGIDVRDALLKYHNQFFSSNIMALVVLGKESLDDLTHMVVDLFASVADHQVSISCWNEHPYSDDCLQIHLRVVPVKDVRTFQMIFPLPDMQPYYKTNPTHYVAHLVGHEGPGSILSLLKARGWSNSLLAGPMAGAKGFMFFMVRVDLSEEGLAHTNDIATIVFQYLAMLRSQEPQEWIFNECANLNAIQFRFKDKARPIQTVSQTSALLHEFCLQEALSGLYLMDEFKPDLIQMVLSNLIPQRVRFRTVSKHFEGITDQVEPWYGTSYSREKIPPELTEGWIDIKPIPELHLPPVNEFIPTDFSLHPLQPESPTVPVLIKDTPFCKLWFKQDDSYFLPKSCLYFDITSPMAYQDPIQCVMTHLYVELVKDAFNEYAYAADISGIEFTLKSTQYGMELRIKGYNDKQRVLLSKLLQKKVNCTINEDRFREIKDVYLRNLKNFKAEPPHQHVLYHMTFLLMEKAWSKEELAACLEDVTAADVQAFVPSLLSHLHVECLFLGNLSKEEALEIAETTESTFTENMGTRALLPEQLVRYREIDLPSGSFYVFHKHNDVHPSSCVEIYYQADVQSTRTNMLLELFCHIIKEPCFNTLRTQEQLGYLVHSGYRRANGSQGLRLLIQSEHNPLYIESRIEAFLKSVEVCLETMSDEEFQRHVQALAVERLDKAKQLTDECNRHWKEIVTQQYNFDRDNIEVSFLNTITLNDIRHFYKEMLNVQAPQRRKLSVHVHGTRSRENEEVDGISKQSQNEATAASPSLQPSVIEDVYQFKASLPLRPRLMPYSQIAKL